MLFMNTYYAVELFKTNDKYKIQNSGQLCGEDRMGYKHLDKCKFSNV